MPKDELWAAVQDHLDLVLTAYRTFEDKKPIILFDIQEQRIYSYPYKEFKEGLSPRSQASLTEQYEEAIASNQIVVFVRDNDQRRLVSYTIDYNRPTGTRMNMAKKKAPARQTKSDFLRQVLSKNIDLDYHQVNRMWAKKGYPGEISNALYYQIRQKLGIVTEWRWVKESERDTTKAARSGSIGEVHQFKITLLETKPPIWRSIQVPDCTLDQLHQYIQTAMGWMNSHLYDFKIDEQSYSDPMMMADTFEEQGHADSTTTRLSQILLKTGARFEYMYDFGDSWQHEVLYEGVKPVEKGRQYPCCLEGARACPPEDVGGTWAYLDFLNAIGDRKNPQHEELLEWVGGKFDPEAFSAVAATKRMKRGVLN